MKCDICGVEVEDAQALQEHVRQMHPPAGQGDDLEAPAMLGDTPEEASEGGTPNPTH
jgi:hypothetical protein